MRSNRLGCLSGVGILAALITALAIAGYAYAAASDGVTISRARERDFGSFAELPHPCCCRSSRSVLMRLPRQTGQ